MNKKELSRAFQEGIITSEKYKEELFKIETAPKEKKRGRKLPVNVAPEEIQSIISNTKQPHHKLAFFLAFNSGLRISEVVKLTPNDFDFERKLIRIRDAKGKKDRSAPLPKHFRESYLKLLPFKFKNECSGIRCLQIAFKGACKRAGMLDKKQGLKFHSLRHGFASNAVEKGMPITHVRDLLGHSSISTTNIYLQANPKKAIESYGEVF